MKIILVVAMSENQVIGDSNKLPWHYPGDLKHFKDITLNKTVVMGRKTYESIGKLLTKRKNIILTKNNNYIAKGCLVYTCLDMLLKFHKHEDLYIIGGAKIYKLFLPIATEIHLTLIHRNVEGDAIFPDINTKEWKCIHEFNEAPHPDYDFYHLTRI